MHFRFEFLSKNRLLCISFLTITNWPRGCLCDNSWKSVPGASELKSILWFTLVYPEWITTNYCWIPVQTEHPKGNENTPSSSSIHPSESRHPGVCRIVAHNATYLYFTYFSFLFHYSCVLLNISPCFLHFQSFVTIAFFQGIHLLRTVCLQLLYLSSVER